MDTNVVIGVSNSVNCNVLDTCFWLDVPLSISNASLGMEGRGFSNDVSNEVFSFWDVVYVDWIEYGIAFAVVSFRLNIPGVVCGLLFAFLFASDDRTVPFNLDCPFHFGCVICYIGRQPMTSLFGFLSRFCLALNSFGLHFRLVVAGCFLVGT